MIKNYYCKYEISRNFEHVTLFDREKTIIKKNKVLFESLIIFKKNFVTFFNKATTIFKTFASKKFIISKKKNFERSAKRRFIKLKKQISTAIDNEIIKIFNDAQMMFNDVYTND